MDTSDSEHSGEEESGDEWVESGKHRGRTRICCSCSRNSSCKTMKCQCRAARGSCGTSCSCVATKCANRGSFSNIEFDESQGTDIFEGNGSGSASDEKEQSHALASHGAMLLQSALVEKPAETNDENEPRRKPLSDIGNKLVCLIKLTSIILHLFHYSKCNSVGSIFLLLLLLLL
jgi:hypothetical protein